MIVKLFIGINMLKLLKLFSFFKEYTLERFLKTFNLLLSHFTFFYFRIIIGRC